LKLIGIPQRGSSSTVSRSNWNLEVLIFAEGGKLENPEKNPQSKERTNSKLKPLMTPGLRFKPSLSSLTTGSFLLPQFKFTL